MKIIKASFLTVLIFFVISCQPKKVGLQDNDYYKKVDSLMKLMTLQEKIGQTVMYSGGWSVTGPIISDNNISYIKNGDVGAMLNVYTAEGTRKLQEIAVNETRLGIPLLFGYDVIHGFKTIFPINLAAASSWDLDDIEKTSRIAADEASSSGIHWTFAPMLDVARDPRWGRISEGAGEDVFLTSKTAEAYVKGFQGDNLYDKTTILACAKHFVGYGAAQAGRDYHTVNMGEGELRNVYLPPFKAAIDAGVETFMTAFNELNGVPATANKFLYKEILRNEWKFNGFVVTDYTAINELIKHGFAKDAKEATKLAMNAGIDMDMMSSANRKYLSSLVKEGSLQENQVNEACRRVLLAKYKLGLFDNPYKYIDKDREKNTIYKREYLNAARHSAAISSVLLKNDARTLPLNKTQKIALIGPLANDKRHILGNWAAAGDRKGKAASVYDGFKEYLPKNRIFYAKGCEIDSKEKENFTKAISTANKADMIVLVLGEDYNMSGEAASRSSIKLPGNQTSLLKALRNKFPKKKIVLVLMNGRPLDLSEEELLTDAILEAWFPGTMGGLGIADVLFGTYNPSGKLPVTFPRNVGQIPIYYNMKNTGRPIPENNPKQDYKSNYLDIPNTPLYPFGHGLSYTKFTYSNVTLSSKSNTYSSSLEATVDIKNDGDYDGFEIAQLYIHDKVGSVTRPVKELKGFKKIFLKKGETKTITFTINAENLKFYNSNMEYTVEPGEFEIAIQGSSDFKFKNTFVLEDI
ncbi:beta-glucosidase BglX [Polaribacter tangerinus]|uniref:beta-glucosidase BglX n=1 Tax=Polaribacter tangerinus TaxID=1920034 RepID=UPI000B4A9A07|nr:beta-glucosidase BglX [Polaribacter tangerinus]